MTKVVIDDHLLRDVLTGTRAPDLGGIASSLVTTGLWLFRLSSSLMAPDVVGRLSGPVAALLPEQQARFRAQLSSLPPDVEVLHLRGLAMRMAELQHRHRDNGRPLSAAMTEALAAAHALGGAIAVSRFDVGPNLKASAAADSITFHVL
jgi:hypothetical protein